MISRSMESSKTIFFLLKYIVSLLLCSDFWALVLHVFMKTATRLLFSKALPAFSIRKCCVRLSLLPQRPP